MSLEKLFGSTLHLSGSTIELTFPSAYERMHSTFFRTKITSWMAAQEEDYRCTLSGLQHSQLSSRQQLPGSGSQALTSQSTAEAVA